MMMSRDLLYQLTLAALVMILAPEMGLAQEVCHWECEVIDCDYFIDYCDYDCYEVCFPYLNSPTRFSIGQSKSGGTSPKVDQSAIRYGSTKGLPQSRANSKPKTRSGKAVRMKLANPSFQTIKDGHIISTRGSPPKGFALFTECLAREPSSVAAK